MAGKHPGTNRGRTVGRTATLDRACRRHPEGEAHAVVEPGAEAAQAGEAYFEARLGDVVALARQQGLRRLYARARQELLRGLPEGQPVNARGVVGREVRP